MTMRAFRVAPRLPQSCMIKHAKRFSTLSMEDLGNV